MVHDLCVNTHKVYPSPLGYNGFPKSVCTSVNNVACHGIPDDRPLADGDIVNVDVTVYKDGYHGDCSRMFLVGNVDPAGQRLSSICLEALTEAVAVCRHGQDFSKIGYIIEEVAASNNFQVVPCFTGHGIGSYFHGPPDIYHIGSHCWPGRMEAGMTFTIEPVLSEGGCEVVVLEDGWTAITEDGSRTAQWEHTILINSPDLPPEILTSRG
ncbi:hypothetical protein AAG570_010624 [Ranatra chinensis]|uniref:Methionine aminopeptidase n=1 Tax=Ranatra chinensis TaxID=642074 RepID=A0ABD0YZ28_9HEMI